MSLWKLVTSRGVIWLFCTIRFTKQLTELNFNSLSTFYNLNSVNEGLDKKIASVVLDVSEKNNEKNNQFLHLLDLSVSQVSVGRNIIDEGSFD